MASDSARGGRPAAAVLTFRETRGSARRAGAAPSELPSHCLCALESPLPRRAPGYCSPFARRGGGWEEGGGGARLPPGQGRLGPGTVHPGVGPMPPEAGGMRGPPNASLDPFPFPSRRSPDPGREPGAGQPGQEQEGGRASGAALWLPRPPGLSQLEGGTL